MSEPALRTPRPAAAEQESLQHELAHLIVQALNLEVAPEQIDPRAPLYGEGLGLDSIDVLEVALVVAKRYGIELRADARRKEQRRGRLAHLPLHFRRIVLLFGAVNRERCELVAGIRRFLPGKRGLQQPLRDEVRKPAVGCRGV